MRVLSAVLFAAGFAIGLLALVLLILSGRLRS
jgi:uncharacterized membrane protein YciS (DUF1049 family)